MMAAGALSTACCFIVETCWLLLFVSMCFPTLAADKFRTIKSNPGPVPRSAFHQIEDQFSTPNFIIFVFLLAYIGAALTEESAKYLAVVSHCKSCGRDCSCHPNNLSNPLATFVYLGFCAVGFSVTENFLYAFTESDPVSQLITAAIRGVTSLPIHFLSTAFAAIMRAKSQRYPSKIFYRIFLLGPSILLHGTWDFCAFLMQVAKKRLPDSVAAATWMICVAVFLTLGTVALVYYMSEIVDHQYLPLPQDAPEDVEREQQDLQPRQQPQPQEPQP